MDPENTTTDTTAPSAVTTEQPATQPAGLAANQGVTFTAEQQEHVNRIVTKRLEEDRARRPATAPAPKPAPTNTAKPSTEPDFRAELDEMRRSQAELMQRLDYTSRTAKLGLDDARAAALFKVYQANPDGFDETVSTLGIKAPQPAATAAPTATTTEAPRSPAAAPSAPTSSNLPTANGVIDIFAPGVASRLGPQGLRVELEKLWGLADSIKGKPSRPSLPSQRK